jgi:hypothetical protein
VNASRNREPGSARAKLMSELNLAIDDAQWSAWRLGVVEGRNAQALDLYVQLEMIRAEAEALRPSFLTTRELHSLRDLSASREGLQE